MLPRESRQYRCINCGHLQSITTNHTMVCYDYCRECSWKPSFGNHGAHMFGHMYRPFEYAGASA